MAIDPLSLVVNAMPNGTIDVASTGDEGGAPVTTDASVGEGEREPTSGKPWHDHQRATPERRGLVRL